MPHDTPTGPARLPMRWRAAPRRAGRPGFAAGPRRRSGRHRRPRSAQARIEDRTRPAGEHAALLQAFNQEPAAIQGACQRPPARFGGAASSPSGPLWALADLGSWPNPFLLIRARQPRDKQRGYLTTSLVRRPRAVKQRRGVFYSGRWDKVAQGGGGTSQTAERYDCGCIRHPPPKSHHYRGLLVPSTRS